MRLLIIISILISFIYAKSNKSSYINTILLERYVSNKKFYKDRSYFFALIESEYQADNYTIYGGFGLQNKEDDDKLLMNHLYVEYFAENYTIKIGKMVQKLGVLDYFSLMDTLNPRRTEFFDDSKEEIKKIPLWMSSIEYYVNDNFIFKGFVEPFDNKYLNYTNSYVQFMLNQFIPEYFKDEFSQEPLGRELIYPLYANYFIPYVETNIDAYSSSQGVDFKKISPGFVIEYNDDRKKIGVLYFNKYSEVPFLKVDQNLLNAIINYKNGKSPSENLKNYIQSGDYSLIKSIKRFRFQQFGLYSESALGEYGIRTEFSYRDKIPQINGFSSLKSMGFAIDHFFSSAYTVLETQFVHLDKNKKNGYISMLRTQFKKKYFWKFSWYIDNSLILTKVNKSEEYAIVPRVIFGYKQINLTLEGLLSKNNTQANTVSLLLRVTF